MTNQTRNQEAVSVLRFAVEQALLLVMQSDRLASAGAELGWRDNQQVAQLTWNNPQGVDCVIKVQLGLPEQTSLPNIRQVTLEAYYYGTDYQILEKNPQVIQAFSATGLVLLPELLRLVAEADQWTDEDLSADLALSY